MKEAIGYQGLPAVYKEMHGGSLKEADTAIRNTVAVILKCLYEGKSVKFLNEFTISVSERKGTNVTLPNKQIVSYPSFKQFKIHTGKVARETLNK